MHPHRRTEMDSQYRSPDNFLRLRQIQKPAGLCRRSFFARKSSEREIIESGFRRASLDPVNEDVFQLVVEITHLDRPARLAVGLELESSLMERRFASRHTCAPKAVRRRTTEFGSPAPASIREIRLHRVTSYGKVPTALGNLYIKIPARG
jgi:hypothetical protein